MYKSAYKFGISLMASLIMLSASVAAIPMSNLKIVIENEIVLYLIVLKFLHHSTEPEIKLLLIVTK